MAIVELVKYLFGFSIKTVLIYSAIIILKVVTHVPLGLVVITAQADGDRPGTLHTFRCICSMVSSSL